MRDFEWLTGLGGVERGEQISEASTKLFPYDMIIIIIVIRTFICYILLCACALTVYNVRMCVCVCVYSVKTIGSGTIVGGGWW